MTAGRTQVRHAGEVDCSFRVARTTQYSAFLRAERNDVTGASEIVGTGFGVGEQTHRRSAVRRRDAGTDSLTGVDRDGVRRAVLVLVGGVHRGQAQPITIVTVERHAQVAGGVPDHERHQFRGGLLGGEDEVALVLAILVVHDDNSFTCSDICYCALDTVEPGHVLALQSLDFSHHRIQQVHPTDALTTLRPIGRVRSAWSYRPAE